MPSITILIKENQHYKFTARMRDHVKAAVREHLPTEGDFAGVPLEVTIIKRDPLDECVRDHLIVIEAGDDPSRSLEKREIIEKIATSVAHAWGMWSIAVRMRLNNAAFYVYADEIG